MVYDYSVTTLQKKLGIPASKHKPCFDQYCVENDFVLVRTKTDIIKSNGLCLKKGSVVLASAQVTKTNSLGVIYFAIHFYTPDFADGHEFVLEGKCGKENIDLENRSLQFENLYEVIESEDFEKYFANCKSFSERRINKNREYNKCSSAVGLILGVLSVISFIAGFGSLITKLMGCAMFSFNIAFGLAFCILGIVFLSAVFVLETGFDYTDTKEGKSLLANIAKQEKTLLALEN